VTRRGRTRAGLRRLAVVAGFVSLCEAPVAAQEGPPLVLAVVPAMPIEGTFIALTLSPGSESVVASAELAGEPVHFERDTLGLWRAVAAVPLGADSVLWLRLTVTRPEGVPRVDSARIAVGRGRFAVDRLRVAPRFAESPDSALAARIAAERERAFAVSARSHDTPRLWRGSFGRPRPARVTSEFGRAREFNGEVQSRHLGVDLRGQSGAPVRAPNRGVVALVDDTYYGGNVVYLDHGAGLVTAYLHLSRVEVAPGDTVTRGQLLGRVGATGRVTGPHLHWIARHGGVTVDPLSLVRLDLAAFGGGA
jgi:murein DD-endopeptidase MepM/ murein hydrolase activator NlpD